MEGGPLDLLEELGLKNKTWRDFNYLKTGATREENAQKEFQEVLETMQKMNFSPEEQKAIWRCCAAILHMGQIEFDPRSFDDDNAPTRSG